MFVENQASAGAKPQNGKNWLRKLYFRNKRIRLKKPKHCYMYMQEGLLYILHIVLYYTESLRIILTETRPYYTTSWICHA